MEICNKNGIKIEEVPNIKKQKATTNDDLVTTTEEIVVEEVAAENKTITTEEYLLTLATYLKDPYTCIPMVKKVKGECFICGVKTNREERKICPTCLELNKKALYEQYKNGSGIIGL